MKSFEKFIKRRDIFGHPIRLTFNDSGSTFNTSIGGFCTVLLRIIIISFLVVKTWMLLERRDQVLNVSQQFIDFDDLGL